MAKIEVKGGYAIYDIEYGEVVLELIKVTEQRKGIGSLLLDMVKDVARENNMPIGLYAYPQDDSIDEDGLKEFYFANDFEYDPDDVDGKLLAWGK